MADRLVRLREAQEAGDISDAELMNLIDDARNLHMFTPLARNTANANATLRELRVASV